MPCLRWLPPLLALVLLLAPRPAHAQLPIKVGMSGPQADDSGSRVSAGMKFAFLEANNAGGIQGRNLSLVFLDDGANTTRAMANIQRLLDVENVLLLAGVVGSDIVDVAKPLIVQRQVPYVGPYSGADSLRTPFQREFVNIRASFNDEVVAMASFLVQNSRVQRVACLYQNDAFGIGGHAALSAALANVGLELVASGNYTLGKTNVEAAVETIVSAPRKPQAVVLLALQAPLIKFINLYVPDSRADPNCIFTVMSPGWGSTFSGQLNKTLWGRVYFFFAAPLPSDPSWAIARRFTSIYPSTAGALSFEGYLIGRFIVEVLRRTRSADPTAAMFLDEVYNTRMFVLDDLVVGMYSTNYSGCQQAICSCNSGLRGVYTAQLETGATGLLKPGIASMSYSVLECSNPATNVIAPLLFGQLLPDWDAGWKAVALDIGRGIAVAFDEANAAGGAGGRDFVLLQQNYSSNASRAMATLSDRYPLAALLGCVVPHTLDIDLPIASIGNFDTEVDIEDDPFVREEVHLQPANSLEVMALAQWAVQRGCPIHLRAAATSDGPALLDMMVKSVHTLQRKPASVALYTSATDALSTTRRGCLIALGSDDDMLAWSAALPAFPDLHLLTTGAAAMRLMAVYPNASNQSYAARLHFPTPITGQWNTTVPDAPPGEAWLYGYILGKAVVQALVHSEYSFKAYTTPAQLLNAWYTVKLMSSGALSYGPYLGEKCDGSTTECECNEGARSLAVRSVADRSPESPYSIPTCHVAYVPLQEESSTSDVLIPAIAGGVAGFFGCVVLGAIVYFHFTKRNNAAAPKNDTKPFCVLFTDIQASTHLWATVPDVMAPALDKHHALIRKLIAKHNCYEVKTIGDSFMCAAHTPQQAMQLALAIQREFHDADWADAEAINAVYREGVPEAEVGRTSRDSWNGLRVRVGIHFGHGDIKLDPVSKGYDYYGTVVNTAARIESVCHGGQIGVSQAVYDAVQDDLSDVEWEDFGWQPLRGLAEPMRLLQALPAGPLASRTFPPLRLDRDDRKATAMDETADDLDQIEVRTVAPSVNRSSIHPHTATSLNTENFQWVETHPMVVRGDISASDLKRHYAIALTTLSTLLTTQTMKFKQTVVHGLCERLHVADHGVEGVALQRTLRGLVHRVLPATLVNVQHSGLVSRSTSRSHLSMPRGASHATFAGSAKDKVRKASESESIWSTDA
eukprot:EG_transcript_658